MWTYYTFSGNCNQRAYRVTMKYAIGQLVRVRPNLEITTKNYYMDNNIEYNTVTSYMQRQANKIFQVRSYCANQYQLIGFTDVLWTDEMLLPVTRITRTKELL